MLDFFGFVEQPFGTTPDPRFLYPLPSNDEAIASLVCGMEYRVGFAALIADPGMGKTTILLDLLNRYNGKTQTAFIFNTQCTGAGLLRQIADDLGVASSLDLALTHENLKAFFVSHGSEIPVLVVIDEAQNLQDDALEAVRLLSDCETTDRKLLHIVLAGQPQLATKLQNPNLLQLEQRIAISARLERLSEEQTVGYVHHRLKVAGGSEWIFSDEALQKIAECSEGIPREINRLCFNALLLAYASEKRLVDGSVVDEVIEDLELSRLGRSVAARTIPRIVPIDRGTVREDCDLPSDRDEVPAVSSKTGTEGRIGDYSASTLPWLLRLELGQAARGRAFQAAGPTSLAAETAPETPAPPPIPEKQSSVANQHPVFEPLPPPPEPSLRQQILEATESAQFRFGFAAILIAVFLAAITGAIWVNVAAKGTLPVRPSTPQTSSVQEVSGAPTTPSDEKRTRRETRKKNQSAVSKDSRKALATGEGSQEAASLGSGMARPQISPPSAILRAEGQSSRTEAQRVEAKLLERTEPQYPPAAKARHIEGSVRLNLSVGADGKVKMVQVESGNPLFLRDAVKAAREWIYEPATLNGQRIPTEVPVTVRFTLPAPSGEGQ